MVSSWASPVRGSCDGSPNRAAASSRWSSTSRLSQKGRPASSSSVNPVIEIVAGLAAITTPSTSVTMIMLLAMSITDRV